MIIVSQDREDIINFDNVKMINREENRISVDANFGRGDFYCIAEYDTEERAEEVLQEIIKAIIETRKSQELNNLFGGPGIIPSNTYYEMPEE